MTEDMDQLEALAADYVLGTLDEGERRRVRSRLAREPALARLVEEWTLRLSPIAEAVPPVEPPPHVWRRIEAALDAERRAALASPREPIWQRLAFWRFCTAGATAMAAALAVLLFVAPLPFAPTPESRFVAVLNEGPASPAWLVTVDIAQQQLTIRPVTELAPEDKSYELWVVAGGDMPPRSLGLLDPLQEISLPIAAELATPTAALAVSLEPAGGSPTGLPTGPVVYQGALLPVSQ